MSSGLIPGTLALWHALVPLAFVPGTHGGDGTWCCDEWPPNADAQWLQCAGQ